MRVKFFAYLRDYTGCSETDMPLVPTIGDLARNLCERYGSRLREKLLPAGAGKEELGPDIIIMINGRHIAHLGNIDATLKTTT